jgi:hypothetical protein
MKRYVYIIPAKYEQKIEGRLESCKMDVFYIKLIKYTSPISTNFPGREGVLSRGLSI